MSEIINQIPGFEPGSVQTVHAADEVGESFLVAQMAATLREKWNTSVICISLDGHKKAIESLIPEGEPHTRAIVIDQKNPKFDVVIRKALGLVHRRGARAVIVSGAQRLTLQQSISLTPLLRRENISLVLVDVNEDQVELTPIPQ